MSEMNTHKSEECPEFEGPCQITTSLTTIRDFVPVENVPYPCFLMDVPAEPLISENPINLSQWLAVLRKLRENAVELSNKNLVLSCMSIREPYQAINHDNDVANGSADNAEDFEKFISTCAKYFSLTGGFVGFNKVLWPPIVSMPVVRENVRLCRSGGWNIGLVCQDNSGKDVQEIKESLLIENSKESLFYYAGLNADHENSHQLYSVFCSNAYHSLFPFPTELVDLFYADIKNMPPSERSAQGVWTFVLFNLAWKLHPYTNLRAKFANQSNNGCFVFTDKIAHTLESVRDNNRFYYKTGVPSNPFVSFPLQVTHIVSALDNIFDASVDAIDLLIRRVEELVSPPQHISDHSVKIEDRHVRNEQLFCSEIVNPLLHSIGYQDIRYTHGSNEFGKDFIVKDSDKTNEFYVAFVIKAGDVSGSASSKVLTDIITQIDMAFSVSRKLPDGLAEVYISKVIVAISGKFLDNAIERLRGKYEKQCQLGYVHFWDNAKIETLIKEYGI